MKFIFYKVLPSILFVLMLVLSVNHATLTVHAIGGSGSSGTTGLGGSGNSGGTGLGGSGNSGGGLGGSGNSGGSVPLHNPITANTIQELVAKILEIVVKVGAPIILFFIIYVGFLFATARGNETKLTTAKNALVWTLIGGLIILGAQALASIIENTINQVWHG